jgi:hypothetical protein
VALALLALGSASVAPLFVIAASAAVTARDQSLTTALATAKLEELHGLAWDYRMTEGGVTVSVADTSTDLSVTPPGAGGPGLAASPSDTLWRDVPGYVDYLDDRGRPASLGGGPAPTARFVRRWAVQPLPGDANETLILQVMAGTLGSERRPRSGAERRPGDCWLASARTRTRS